jgi:hypothetical protein
MEKKRMDGKKICFVMGVGERYRLMYHISKEFQQRYRIISKYLVFNEIMINYLLSKGVPSSDVIMLKDKTRFGSWGESPVDYEFLKTVEEAYGIPNLYLYWEAVRDRYEQYDQYSTLKSLEVLFRTYLEFIENEAPDIAIMDLFPASVPMLIMSRIMESRGRPFYFLIPSRIERRFVIIRGFEDKYQKVDSIFEQLKSRELTPHERSEAEAFVSKYHQGRRYFSTSERAVFLKKDFDPDRIKRGFEFLIEAYRYGLQKKSFRKHSFWSPLEYAWKRTFMILRKQYLKRHRLFQNPAEGESFVLFLLHKQPEATTFVKSPFFMDQRYLIEVIAKSVPSGYWVYVKPHHNDFGSWPLSYYKEMVCRPNVKMLKTYLNSQDLIKRSSCVITISGTAGWEGIILGKPVITFGRVFYNSFDQVMHVKNIWELPDMIKRAIYEYRPDMELMLKYVSAHIQGSYPGVPLSPILTNGSSLSSKNIRNIVDGIVSQAKFDGVI